MNTIEEYIKKYISEMAELKERANSSKIASISREDFYKNMISLILKEQLPNEITEWLSRLSHEEDAKGIEFDTLIKNDHIMSHQEALSSHSEKSPEEIAKIYENMVRYAQLFEVVCVSQEIHDLPTTFFKSIGPDEFGMSRLMADPLNNVPKMLNRFSEPEMITQDLSGYNLYEIVSIIENSRGDTLRLSHRFRAQNKDDALKRSQAFIKRITGRQKRVLAACWAMANIRLRRTFTCNLSELMEIAYPNRKETYFSTDEKVEFYQDMLDLSETKLKVQKKEKKGKRRKEKNTEYILPFITIHKTIDSLPSGTKQSEKYPNQVSISVLHNPLYEEDKMYSVGAGIKYKTLELHADDLQLAEYIQIRKSQVMKEKYITFTSRIELLKIAKLDGISHSGMANKTLLQKLARLKEKGIILDYPKKVSEIMQLKIR